jgi:hypothetical protein
MALLIIMSPYNISSGYSTCFTICEDTHRTLSFEIASGGFESIMLDVGSVFSIYGNLTVTAPSDGLVTLMIMDQLRFFLIHRLMV